MKHFKNRFFMIALLVAIVLVVVPTVLSLMGHGGPVRSAIGVVATPFRWCAMKCADAVEGFVAYFAEFDRLREDNERLSELLREYEGSLDEADALAEENAWLRDYLGIRDEHVEYVFQDAKVIGRESGNHTTVYLINRGTAHGLAADMPVVTVDGVVGRISECDLFSSRVVILTETTSAVGAITQRSAEIGIVEGSFDLWADGLCRMSYIRQDADVAVGDVVLTSGTGSVYPYGLTVGRIVEVRVNEANRTLEALVAPAVDLASLTRVMILVDCAVSEREDGPLTGDDLAGAVG